MSVGLGCRVAVSSAGLLLGVPGPFGPRVAFLRGLGTSAPEWTRTLGESDARCEQAPAVCFVGSSAQAAFVEGGVAKRVALPTGAARVVATAASRVALVAHGRHGYVVTAGRALLLHSPEPGEAPVVLRKRCEALAALEVVSLRGSVLVFYAPVGAAVLGVCRWDGEGVRDVRHPLRAPCLELSAQASGESAGLALGYGDDGLDFARVDAAGQMRERPHGLMRGHGAPLSSPTVLWVESAFGLCAASQGGVRFGGLRGAERLAVAQFPAPLGAAYLRWRLLLVAATEKRAGAEVVVFAQDRAGERRQTHVHALLPADEGLRRRRSALRDLVSDLVSRGRVAGRDASPLHVLDPGLGVWLSTPTRSLRLELTCLDAGVRLKVGAADEVEEEPPPESSLLRLSRWVRRSFGMSERARTPEEEALLVALKRALPEAALEAVHGAGGATEISLHLNASPSLEDLLRVLAACRELPPGAAEA